MGRTGNQAGHGCEHPAHRRSPSPCRISARDRKRCSIRQGAQGRRASPLPGESSCRASHGLLPRRKTRQRSPQAMPESPAPPAVRQASCLSCHSSHPHLFPIPSCRFPHFHTVSRFISSMKNTPLCGSCVLTPPVARSIGRCSASPSRRLPVNTLISSQMS